MNHGAVPFFKTSILSAALMFAFGAAAQEPVPSQPAAPPVQTATPSQPNQPADRGESPADAYDRAMQPVEIVRRSPNNVTDSEIAAWGVAVTTAAHSCATRRLEDFAGEELFHFARLCQLGQQYEDAYAAARKYISAGNTKSAESARALIVRASLSAGNLLRAQQSAYDLLRTYPYDGTVHTLVQETIMALAATDAMENAINMVEERSSSLISAMQVQGGLALHEGSYKVPQSTLVRDALEAAYMYRAENRVLGAQPKADALIASIRQIVDAAAPSVSAVERDAMQAAIHRAEMLMTAAPPVPVEASSAKSPAPRTVIPYEKNITVLAFYAPWSPQRTQMFELLGNMARDYKTFPVHLYAISTAAVATGSSDAKSADVLTQLLEQFGKNVPAVPIVVTTDAVTHSFALDDWPMFAVVDTEGKLRFLDTLTSPEYKDGGRMHRLVAALASQAGPLPTPPATVRTKPGRVKVPEGTLQRVPK